MPNDYDPAEQLAAAAGRLVSNSRTDRVAGMGYLQAVMVQAAVQALIDLLKQKNVFSEAEITRALNASYDERFRHMSGSNGAVLQPAPTTKRN